MALAQGLRDEGVPTDSTESTQTTLLLDRLAEAGGLEAQDPQADGASALEVIEALDGLDAMGAVEALMAYLVMRQSTPIDPDAVTALPGDIVALLQQIEGGPEGVATDLELATQQAVQTAIDLTGTGPAAAGEAVVDAIAEMPDVTPVALDGAEPTVGLTAAASDLAASAAEPATEGLRIAPDDAVTAVPGDERPKEILSAASEGVSMATGPGAAVDTSTVGDTSTRPNAASTSGGTGAEMVAGMTGGQQQAADPAETVVTTRVVNASTLPAEVSDTVRVAAFRGDAEVRLVLNPPDLGHLDIHISRGEHGLRIVIEASQAGARELLDRSITGLHQALEARDLRVDRLEVRATDTGRGSLDTSAGGQQSGAGAFHGGPGEDAPEWSPVTKFESMSNATGTGQSEQTTAGDSSTLSGSAGSVDVLA